MPRQMVWHSADAAGTFPYKVGGGGCQDVQGALNLSAARVSPLKPARCGWMHGPILLGEGVHGEWDFCLLPTEDLGLLSQTAHPRY